MSKRVIIIRNKAKQATPSQRPAEVEELSVIELARKYPPVGWESLFKDADEELELVSSILDNRGFFCPKKSLLFQAFDLCPLDKVNVVIFGQDPYHQVLANGEPRAQGLAFSVSKKDDVPNSLQNIYKELNDDLGIDNRFSHGDLTSWSRQGVLLVNACLTVEPGVANSHKRIWLGFINKLLKHLAQSNPRCIYLLWGEKAQQLSRQIEGSPIILKAAHPSGYSASKGFFGCKHFSQVNVILEMQGKTPINWKID